MAISLTQILMQFKYFLFESLIFIFEFFYQLKS